MAFGLTFEMNDEPDGFNVVFDTSKRLKTITNSEKVEQDVTLLLKTQVGEDIFNESFGFDFAAIINSSSVSMVKQMIAQALYQYPYVRNIESITITSWNREERRIIVRVKVEIEETPTVVTYEVVL